ncbi:hypothetical protein P7C70_g7415, partial [Phenoliferia sp. Uapishka_3]
MRNILTLPLLATLSTAQILYRPTPKSCLDQSSSTTAPQSQQLNLTDLYFQFDIGQSNTGQYSQGYTQLNDSSTSTSTSTRPSLRGTDEQLIGKGQRTLRLVFTGTTGETSEGYSNSTSFLSTIDSNSQVLTFPIFTNESALCSSIRSPSATTTTTTNGSLSVTDSGCPFGPGQIALGLDVPLGSSYPLTTITTRLVVLDPSVPPLHLACYDIDVTPFYPSYFPYNLIRYLVVALLSLYFIAYLIARIWAAHTDFIHESETQLATSLTLKLSSTETAGIPKRRVWG